MRTCAGVSSTCLALGTACGSAPERHHPELEVAEVHVDVGRTLEVEPGIGAGAHVQALSSGEWEVLLTCDTEQSGYMCGFDLIASVEPPATIRSVRGNDLERADFLGRIDAGAVELLASTSYDYDGLRFLTQPGEPLRVDILLDGAFVPESVVWVEAGVVQKRAPSMPLDFVPRKR